MSKYTIYTLKRYIPLYAVTLAVCFSAFVFIVAYLPDSRTYTTSLTDDPAPYYYTNNYGYSGLLNIIIPLIIFTTILPFFANSYRYSLKSADLFNQIGKGKRMIRFTNNLVLLSAVLVSFTAAFILSLAIMLFKQLPHIGVPDQITDTGQGYLIINSYIVFNYGYYILAYLCSILVGTANYFISYFFVTRGNNFINSAICLIMGEIILGAGLMAPFWYATAFAARRGTGNDLAVLCMTIFGTKTATAVGPAVWIFGWFEHLILGFGESYITEGLYSAGGINYIYNWAGTTGLVISIVGLVLFFGMGIIGLLFFLKEEESSGEFAGKAPGRDNFQIILYHVGFGLIGFLEIGCLGGSLLASLFGLGITTMFAMILFYGALYYVFLGLLRRNFRMNKKEIIIMACVIGTNILLGLTCAIPF